MAQDVTNDWPVVMTVAECAAYLKIGRSHAYEMIKTGAIPSIRLGRKILISRQALSRMLDGSNAIEERSGDMENIER